MQQHLLNVNNLKIAFREEQEETEIVHGISFNVAPGEVVGIAGESGCGKSLTAQSIMGLLPKNCAVTSGQIIFQGNMLNPLSESSLSAIRGNEIAMIFQDSLAALNPTMRVGKQLTELLIKHKHFTKKDAHQAVIDMLKDVGISAPQKRFKVYPHQLSGGMRQRVMIAMGLILKPKLLIADEPTTALDVSTQAQILDLIVELKHKYNTAIIFITHDLGVLSKIADRIMIIYVGHAVEIADTHAIFKQPKHPYTQGLLKSIPTLETSPHRLHAIKGTVPNQNNLPKGCVFAPRCTKAFAKCQVTPPKCWCEKSTKVACHLYAQSNRPIHQKTTGNHYE